MFEQKFIYSHRVYCVIFKKKKKLNIIVNLFELMARLNVGP